MKILIVNLYPLTPNGIKVFTEFNFIIRKVFFLDQKEIYDSDLDFITRNRDEIDEFLYEFNSSYMKKENGYAFDHTDIIFIVGSSGLLPWSPKARKVLALLRMCLKCQKILFASGDAMLCLIFLCASDIEKNINIINGNGQGSKLSEIFKIKKELSKLELTDFFLDNVTGDIYSFNRESEEWHPKGNVGLHHRRSAEEYQTLGKYIVKAPIYRPKKLTELVEIYKAKTTESIIYIKKNYMNHWALKNIYPLEFKAQLLGEWDCHAFSFVNKDKMFYVLAESERGPCILDFGNILALHFNVEKNYSTTIPIVKNFIERAIDIMKNYKSYSVKKIMETFPKSQVIDLISFKSPKNSSKKTKVREAIKHDNDVAVNSAQNVGFSFAKKTFPKIIANNAVTLNIDSVPKALQNKTKESMAKKAHHFETNDSLNSNIKTEQDYMNSTSEKEEIFLSKKKIRSILHPALSTDSLKDEKIWVPGFLSRTSFKKIIMKKDSSELKGSEPYFRSVFSSAKSIMK